MQALSFHAHQTYRANVDIAGSIDGTDVATIPFIRSFDPFISRAGFFEVEARHGCTA